MSDTALPGYDARLVVDGDEVFYANLGPDHQGDSLDVSTTGPKGRKKRRIVGQEGAALPASLVWSTEQNPNADPPNLVVGEVLENVQWFPQRDEPGHWFYERINVVGVKMNAPVNDAIRYEVTLESDGDFYWVD